MTKTVAKRLKRLNFLKPFVEPQVSGALVSEGLRVTGQRQLVSKGDLQLFTDAVKGEGLGVGWKVC